MFISYNYKQYLGKKDGKHTWGYEITDSEFGTSSGVVNVEKTAYVIDMATAVIQDYSKRKLNVAANLAVAFAWLHKQYPNVSIQYIIDWNKVNNHLFLPYEKDLQKYFLLL
jgi:hypothetical protein